MPTPGCPRGSRLAGTQLAEIIVALDLPSATDALRLADSLPGLSWAKVGPVLFVRDGPRVVSELQERGCRVFLDLKWHDIPHVVSEAVKAATALGVDLCTVHALGGEEMLRAAVSASGSMRVVAVSVLTSHSAESYWKAVGRSDGGSLNAETRRMAALAIASGVHGVVVSPQEVRDVRETLGPAPWIVVPGIRPPGTSPRDQQRTGDAGGTARAGASHLVVGRPITEAKDPRAVYEELCRAAR